MFIVTIDIEKCRACAECIEVCPNEMLVLTEEDGKQYAMFAGDPDDCMGCFSCEEVCEEGAVTITEL